MSELEKLNVEHWFQQLDPREKQDLVTIVLNNPKKSYREINTVEIKRIYDWVHN